MEKAEKRVILERMLNAQELGTKSQLKILDYFDRDVFYEDAEDPLSTFIFDAVMKADDEEDIKSNIGYAIKQMTKAQQSI